MCVCVGERQRVCERDVRILRCTLTHSHARPRTCGRDLPGPPPAAVASQPQRRPVAGAALEVGCDARRCGPVHPRHVALARRPARRAVRASAAAGHQATTPVRTTMRRALSSENPSLRCPLWYAATGGGWTCWRDWSGKHASCSGCNPSRQPPSPARTRTAPPTPCVSLKPVKPVKVAWQSQAQPGFLCVGETTLPEQVMCGVCVPATVAYVRCSHSVGYFVHAPATEEELCVALRYGFYANAGQMADGRFCGRGRSPYYRTPSRPPSRIDRASSPDLERRKVLYEARVP